MIKSSLSNIVREKNKQKRKKETNAEGERERELLFMYDLFSSVHTRNCLMKERIYA